MPSQSKDPFEAAALGDPDTPPDSPVAPNLETRATTAAGDDDDETTGRAAAGRTNSSVALAAGGGKGKEEDEEEEEANMLSKFPSGDPDKVTKMQAILSQFTEEQMSRYESFRRSGFQKANMKKLLASITGNPKISVPMTIVVSGIAKMFVGELVEMARIVMTERKESGPIRPSHIREAYRRLKLDGKVPKRSVPRLFR
ncbi:transcription initiation factor TFIID subunit 11-like [Aristolochia californica]|uniref:transcription initiation factor TFIID subunit 11-like n=1 Tax=Aristolochia californica TaxID=171875 RepID=UPI0035DBDE00